MKRLGTTIAGNYAARQPPKDVSDPMAAIQRIAQHDLDPVRKPKTLRTLADMTEEEIRALELKYGCPVRRPK